MKFFAHLTAAVAAVLLAAEPALAETHYKATCETTHPAVMNTINTFCKAIGTKAMTTDSIVQNGVHSSSKYKSKTWIAITSHDCTHPEWIPQDYCYSQLWSMCADLDPKAGRFRTYDGCQVWGIQYTPAPNCGSEGCIGAKDNGECHCD